MADYATQTFRIGLPEGVVDLSTHAFVIPSSAEFKPSIVIKSERRQGTPQLTPYVRNQLESLRNELANLMFVMESAGRHGGYESYSAVFEWGPQERRIRQQQLFVAVPQQSAIFTLTATNLASEFEFTERLFHAVFRSFDPK